MRLGNDSMTPTPNYTTALQYQYLPNLPTIHLISTHSIFHPQPPPKKRLAPSHHPSQTRTKSNQAQAASSPGPLASPPPPNQLRSRRATPPPLSILPLPCSPITSIGQSHLAAPLQPPFPRACFILQPYCRAMCVVGVPRGRGGGKSSAFAI